jgi:hypothetical protein
MNDQQKSTRLPNQTQALVDLKRLLQQHPTYQKIQVPEPNIILSKGHSNKFVTPIYLCFFVLAPLFWMGYESFSNGNYHYLLFLFIPYIFAKVLLKVVSSETTTSINLNTNTICVQNADALLGKIFQPKEIAIQEISAIEFTENVVYNRISATRWNELTVKDNTKSKTILASFAQTPAELAIGQQLKLVIDSSRSAFDKGSTIS